MGPGREGGWAQGGREGRARQGGGARGGGGGAGAGGGVRAREEGRESEAERSSREVRYQAHAWQLSATDPLGLRVDGATALGFILPAFLT